MLTSLSETITTIVLAFLPFAAVLAVVLRKPYYIVELYVIIILMFTASAIGASKELVLIYGRGSGVLPLPIINFFLIAVFGFFFCLRFFPSRKVKIKESFKPGNRLLLLFGFSIIYLLVGGANGVPVNEVLSAKGIVNIVNMCLFVFILKWSTESSDQLDGLVKVALWCLAISAFYGIVRFLFLGGDPANSYGNELRVNVRLTYQDIGQSILFGFAFGYSTLKLLRRQFAGPREQAFFAALALLSVLNIFLSYRRNAWFGFIIVVIWLLLVVDLGKKMVLITVATCMIIFLGGYVVAKRFTGQNIGGTKYTVTGDFSAQGGLSLKRGRFAELWNASTDTLERHPLFGFGPWGHYGSKYALYDLGKFAFFTHSAIVHVLMKTGLIGLFLFCWPFASLIFWMITRRKTFPKNSKYMTLCDAAFGGFLFTIPEILFATPVIIFRHLQITALFIGLMYCAYLFRDAQTNTGQYRSLS
ncbi:MAG TPA: O-antigen ligase family protein [Geobacteraceae bacterium]|nr:O-antigen ligase family protein [Geobacteraceae bacterium]